MPRDGSVRIRGSRAAADRAADPRLAPSWGSLPEESGDERRLACAIGADERDEVVPPEHRGEVFHEHATWDLHAKLLHRDHLVAVAFGAFGAFGGFGGLEAEVHRRRIAGRRREAWEALEPLALALKGVHSGEIAPDVLLRLHVRALALQLALAREPALGPLRTELEDTLCAGPAVSGGARLNAA